MSNNFGSKDIIAIEELAHVVPSYINLVNKFLFFLNRSTIWFPTLIMNNL